MTDTLGHMTAYDASGALIGFASLRGNGRWDVLYRRESVPVYETNDTHEQAEQALRDAGAVTVEFRAAV